MAALFKYLVSVAAIVSAVIVGANFLGFVAVIQTPATTTPAWKIERLKPDPDTPFIAHGSLSPIYPATPGKELLGKPVNTARPAKKLQEPMSAKRIDVRQALQLHKVRRQISAAGEQSRNYPQQSLSYAETRPSQPRTLSIFGHGIY